MMENLTWTSIPAIFFELANDEWFDSIPPVIQTGKIPPCFHSHIPTDAPVYLR